MKMKSLLLALILLLTCSCALAADTLPGKLEEIDAGAFENADLSGNLTLPASVQSIGSRAFAGTGLHALIVPAGCASVDATVLADTPAAYVTINGSNTVINASALTDVPFVFGPASSQVSGMSGFYALSTLVNENGLYYSVGATEVKPLCAVSTGMGNTVAVPKVLNNVPVRSLATLVNNGIENVTIYVPDFLLGTTSLTVSTYDSMVATAPAASTAVTTGSSCTFTTSVGGAYGDVAYTWTITEDGVSRTVETSAPSLTITLSAQETMSVAVACVDELGDTAEASADFFMENAVTYRALLVGNTYPGEYSALPGPDNDVYAMYKMLSLFDGTDYAITRKVNVSASSIQSAINSALGAADSNDVSIFYYSGHGTSSGSLCGTGGTYVSVDTLRSWLDTVSGTKIVLLDCCYSGAHIDKSTSSFNSAVISAFSWKSKDNLATDGYIVMTACNKKETSASLGVYLSDGSEFWFGAFTYGLCYGSGYDMIAGAAISTAADINNDGAVTLGEAYNAAVNEVETTWGVSQSTQYYGDTSFVLWSD